MAIILEGSKEAPLTKDQIEEAVLKLLEEPCLNFPEYFSSAAERVSLQIPKEYCRHKLVIKTDREWLEIDIYVQKNEEKIYSRNYGLSWLMPPYCVWHAEAIR